MVNWLIERISDLTWGTILVTVGGVVVVCLLGVALWAMDRERR